MSNGIIFDCDGVLVDVAESYYTTIIKTTSHVLERLGALQAPPVSQDMIQFFKDTGAFNNEIDLTYAAILMMAASERANIRRPKKAFAGCNNMQDVESRAASICDMSDVIDTLSYPSPDSMVQTVFNQLFYGPDMYQKIFEKKSEFAAPGFIQKECVLLDDTLRKWLPQRFGDRIGMVTGRGHESASHTLGEDMNMFSVGAYLEDEPRHMAKPNPESLVHVIDMMMADNCVYVGDSMEDLIMARAAMRNITFVGVWGTAYNPQRRRQLFLDRGADHTIEGIGELPALLE